MPESSTWIGFSTPGIVDVFRPVNRIRTKITTSTRATNQPKGRQRREGSSPVGKSIEEEETHPDRDERGRVGGPCGPGASGQRPGRFPHCVPTIRSRNHAELDSEPRDEEDPADPVAGVARDDERAHGRVHEERDDQGDSGRRGEVGGVVSSNLSEERDRSSGEDGREAEQRPGRCGQLTDRPPSGAARARGAPAASCSGRRRRGRRRAYPGRPRLAGGR